MTVPVPLCFIVGPIGTPASPERKLADFVQHMIIKPVAKPHGYEVKRADDDARPGSISAAVIRDVLEADLVIADLTGFNPNAFYELGIRHAVGKPTIHLIAEQVKLPFDNIDQRTIFVDTADHKSIEEAKDRLTRSIKAVQHKDYKDSNPITQARGLVELSASSDSRDQQIVALKEQVAVLAERVEQLDFLTASGRMMPYQGVPSIQQVGETPGGVRGMFGRGVTGQSIRLSELASPPYLPQRKQKKED